MHYSLTQALWCIRVADISRAFMMLRPLSPEVSTASSGIYTLYEYVFLRLRNLLVEADFFKGKGSVGQVRAGIRGPYARSHATPTEHNAR